MIDWFGLDFSAIVGRMTGIVHSRRAALAAGALAFAHLGAAPAVQADPARLLIANDSTLQFGSFAVADRGYRIISPSGAVQSVGIFSTATGDTSPARFTITYDRGNNGRRNLNLRMQVMFANPAAVTQKGLTARLSAYQTDIPGASTVRPGQTIDVTIPNCVRRVCSTSFNVGARLDVERSYGGGQISLPIPVDVVLISVR